MPTIATLTRAEIGLQWIESVAVVAEVASVLLARGLASVPAAESIALTADGTIRFLNDGSPDPAPARRLGGLLKTLLDGVSCPPELRTLVADSVAEAPAYTSVLTFADALSFFERPGRADVLQALAARTSEITLQAHVDAELERLKTRARNLPDDANQQPRRRSVPVRRLAILVAVPVLLLGVLAGAVFALYAGYQSRATLTERVRTSVTQIAKSGLAAVGLPNALETTTPPPEPVEKAAPRPVPTPVKARQVPHDRPVTVSVRALAARPLPAFSSRPMPDTRELVRDDTIYSEADNSVQPAELIRPKLPTEPPATLAADDVGILEIIVSASGAVEQVRLISTANRYQERMLVAAAKAWPFEPATKDGRPVRYRTRIRVTL
jgi:hypothetical protein